MTSVSYFIKIKNGESRTPICELKIGEIMLKSRVLNLLQSGRQFTPAQLAGLVGSTEDSIRPRISELRSEGHAIYTNTTKNGKSAYRLGKPSRQMVAAAYKQAGSTAFSA